jgi:hypothetical protein
MLNIIGWHPPWSWPDLGEPIASFVVLPVALCALVLMLDGWPLHISRGQPRPGPGRPLRAVIAVICAGTVLAALCVIGRYWVGPNLAHWAWAWGVRWTLPVLITVIVLIASIRREASRQEKLDTPPPSSATAPDEAPSGTV